MISYYKPYKRVFFIDLFFAFLSASIAFNNSFDYSLRNFDSYIYGKRSHHYAYSSNWYSVTYSGNC